MSATEAPSIAGITSSELPLRGLKLPPPEPPKLSLTIKIFLMAALLIFIAVGGAVAVSAYRSRAVADAKIAEDLIYDRRHENYDPLQELLALFADSKEETRAPVPTNETVEERLKRRVPRVG